MLNYTCITSKNCDAKIYFLFNIDENFYLIMLLFDIYKNTYSRN